MMHLSFTSGRRVLSSALTAALLSFASVSHALDALSDGELSGITGREGILVSIEYYYNSSPYDDPSTTAFNEAGAALPGFCSSPNGGSSLGNMNCRLALQFENRDGIWLLAKNGHASLAVNRLSMDAAFLGDAASAASPLLYNDAKFRDADGSCLLGECSASWIAKMPGLRTHYPGTGGSYNPASTRSIGYDDVKFGLFIEGIGVEYDSAPGAGDGWSRDQSGAFMGVSIRDNNGYQAGIAFGGNFYLYGF